MAATVSLSQDPFDREVIPLIDREIAKFIKRCEEEGQNGGGWSFGLKKIQEYIPQCSSPENKNKLLYQAARFHHYLGNHDLALETLAKVGDSVNNHFLKVSIYLSKNNIQLAGEELTNAERLFDFKDPVLLGQIHYLKARILFAQNNLGEAKEHLLYNMKNLSKVNEAEEIFIQSELLLARILFMSGNANEANELLNTHPQFHKRPIEEFHHCVQFTKAYWQYLILTAEFNVPGENSYANASQGLESAKRNDAKDEIAIFENLLKSIPKPVPEPKFIELDRLLTQALKA